MSLIALFDTQRWRRLQPAGSPGVAYPLDVDALAVAHTDYGVIVPARAGQLFVISRYSVQVLAATGAATVVGAFDFGVTPPNFSDQIANNTYGSVVNLNAGAGQISVQGAVNFYKGAVGQAIHLASNTPVTGPTLMRLRVAFTGFWESAT